MEEQMPYSSTNNSQRQENNELDYFVELGDQINDLKDSLDNIMTNVAMIVQNQGIATDIALLRKENEAYRSDAIMKIMRQYGIDAMIKIYSEICTKLFIINHDIDEGKKLDPATLEWLLKRLERRFKNLGIKLEHSEIGTSLDESKMALFGDEEFEDSYIIRSAESPLLINTIAESVIPAFVWTIPSINSLPEKQWYLEVEKVCIYK